MIDACNKQLLAKQEEKQEERGSCQTLVRQEAYFCQLVRVQSV